MTTYKEKIHIFKKKYWIKSYEHIIDKCMAVEVGIGNNKIVPKPEEGMAVLRFTNTDESKETSLKVRFVKKNSTYHSSDANIIQCGPGNEFDGVEIMMCGPKSPERMYHSVLYATRMINGYFHDSGLILD